MEFIWFNKGISISIFNSQIDINRAAYPLGLFIICAAIRLYLSGFSLSKIKSSMHSFFQGKVLFICLSLFLIALTIVSFYLYKNYSLPRGLEGQYFKTMNFKEPIFTRVDSEINFAYPLLMEVAKTNYSIRWEGYIYIPKTNEYTFLLISDDGSWLYLDDKLVIDNGEEHALRRRINTINLHKGFHSIKVSYFQKDSNSQLYLLWKPRGNLQKVVPTENLFTRLHTSKELIIDKLTSIFWKLAQLLWIIGLILLAWKIWKNKKLKNKYAVPFLLFLIIGLSLVLRLFLLQYSLGFTDSDEAVEGLMAKHILQRGERPIFYYGLAYMGSLKSHIAAIIYALFGVSVAGLKFTTTLFFFGFAFSLYYLAKQLFDEKIALISTLIVALSPLYLSYKSLMATAAYMEILFLGTLLLIIFHKLIYKRLSSERENRLYCAAGFIAGLGFWLNPLIINYVIVGFIFILLKKHRFLISKGFILALIFFLVGCFPLLIWNYNNSWHTISFILGSGQISLLKKLVNIPQNLLQIFTQSIPILLGVNRIHSPYSLIGNFSWLILGIYAASFFFICYKREKGLSKILKLSLKETNGVDILIVLTFFVIILYLNSEFADRALYPRYLLPLYSTLPIFVAVFLWWIKKYSHLLFVFLLLSILACNIYGNIYFYDQIKLENKKFKTFLSILEERNLNLAYSGFWQAYKITLATNEKVVCSPKMYDPHLDRYPYYSELIRRSKRVAIIVKMGSKRSEALESRLRKKNISFKHLDYYYSIYHSFSKRFWGGELKKSLRRQYRK
jgi:4-amino-4-deoxy-L-arabinose transferase-like glycosyltransferase